MKSERVWHAHCTFGMSTWVYLVTKAQPMSCAASNCSRAQLQSRGRNTARMCMESTVTAACCASASEHQRRKQSLQQINSRVPVSLFALDILGDTLHERCLENSFCVVHAHWQGLHDIPLFALCGCCRSELQLVYPKAKRLLAQASKCNDQSNAAVYRMR